MSKTTFSNKKLIQCEIDHLSKNPIEYITLIELSINKNAIQNGETLFPLRDTSQELLIERLLSENTHRNKQNQVSMCCILLFLKSVKFKHKIQMLSHKMYGTC